MIRRGPYYFLIVFQILQRIGGTGVSNVSLVADGNIPPMVISYLNSASEIDDLVFTVEEISRDLTLYLDITGTLDSRYASSGIEVLFP